MPSDVIIKAQVSFTRMCDRTKSKRRWLSDNTLRERIKPTYSLYTLCHHYAEILCLFFLKKKQMKYYQDDGPRTQK